MPKSMREKKMFPVFMKGKKKGGRKRITQGM